jgi:flagellar motor switch protein FliN/FliY
MSNEKTSPEVKKEDFPNYPQYDIKPIVDDSAANSEDAIEPAHLPEELKLSNHQKEGLSEIGNMTMGSSSPALSELVNQQVKIISPAVAVTNWESIKKDFPDKVILVNVKYTKGLLGNSILLLKTEDAKTISDLMMGGNGSNKDGELNEFHLSAIAEAIKRMVESSSSSMSSMMDEIVEVAQPEIFAKIISNEDLQFILNDDSLDSYFVKTSFRFTIGSLVDSKIVQFLGRPFAINIFESMISKTGLKNEDDITGDNMDPEDLNKDISMDALSASQSRTADILLNMGAGMESRKNTDENTENGKKNLAEKNSRNNLNVNTTANTNNSPDDRNVQNHHDENIVQFPAEKSRNIDMLMAVPMDITVELGRIEKPIKDILNMGPGSILELDKFKGDRVDIMVNGKKIAIGEVVVVDNSYGVRITDIVKSKDRF